MTSTMKAYAKVSVSRDMTRSSSVYGKDTWASSVKSKARELIFKTRHKNGLTVYDHGQDLKSLLLRH